MQLRRISEQDVIAAFLSLMNPLTDRLVYSDYGSDALHVYRLT
jgi:hypothetical protein